MSDWTCEPLPKWIEVSACPEGFKLITRLVDGRAYGLLVERNATPRSFRAAVEWLVRKRSRCATA